MESNILRLYAFLLLWIMLSQKCTGQTALLTIISDQCITNTSSGMAWIYNLSKIDSLISDVSQIIPTNNQNSGIQGLCAEPECFPKSNWSYVDSLTQPNVNNLIMDRRWEGLKTYVTKNNVVKAELLDYKPAVSSSSHEDFTISFSVQTKNDVNVFMCEGPMILKSNCYRLMLHASDGAASGFQKCEAYKFQSNFSDRLPWDFCTLSLTHQTRDRLVISENHWSHFRFVKTNNAYSLQHPNGSEIFSGDTQDLHFVPRHLFFNTEANTGLWKLHYFNYLYTDTADEFFQLVRPFTVSNGQNCLAMFALMCELCWMEIKILQYVKTFYLITNENILQTTTINTQGQQWKEVKFTFDMTEQMENVFLRIISRSSSKQNNFWAFNNLRTCEIDEIRVLKPANPLNDTGRCQLVENETVLEIKDKKISPLDNWKNCKANQFGKNCLSCELIFEGEACPRNTKYCQLLSEKSGTIQMCDCPFGNQGQNCQAEGIYIFDDLPQVEVDSTSCNITFKSFRLRGNPNSPPQFYKFQYKKLNWKNWRDVTIQPLRFNISEKVTISNLELNSTYFVRVFGFGKNKDLLMLEDLSNEIEFLTFHTVCTDINENQIKIEANNFSARIYYNLSEEQLKHVCDLSRYFLIAEKPFIEEKPNEFVLNELNPCTKYIIWVQKNDKALFSKSFFTAESVPEKVEIFEHFKTNNPLEVYLRWLKPVNTNCKLLFYDISFQVKRYLACQEMTKDEEFKISVSASHENWLVNSLKPYVEYNIEIKANTSVGFGPPTLITVTTNPDESVEEEEFPEVNMSFPNNDEVEIKFHKLSCEKKSGPLYVDATVIGMEFCNHTMTLNDEINMTLIFRGLRPFCKYNAKFKFYRRKGVFLKETNIIFKTLESVPGKVEHFQCLRTNNPLELNLRWSKPASSNGILLFYDISFQVKKYLACQEMAKKEGFQLTLPASHDQWLVKLKPLAEYNIEIKANTSAGFGPPAIETVKIGPVESVDEDEIPKLYISVPGTDNVVFKFRKVPCEKKSGPLYIDIVIIGTEFWCNHSKNLESQELDDDDLVFGNLKPFCKYDAKLKFYRRKDNILRESAASFKTLESESVEKEEFPEVNMSFPNNDEVEIKFHKLSCKKRSGTLYVDATVIGKEFWCNHTMTLNDEINMTLIFRGLRPFCKYNAKFKFYRRKGVFLKETDIIFKTLESVPGKVEHFQCLRTNNPLELNLRWSKPASSNGILLFYDISFQVKKYLACQEMAKKEGFQVTLPASHDQWLVKLKPLAEYNIKIKANTSAGFGPPAIETVKIGPVESVDEDEIPKLYTSVPGTDNVVFKFRKVPCEKKSGPLYIDIVIIGKEFWCNNSKNLESQELDDDDLVFGNLKPFCKYDAKLKFYRRKDNILWESAASFKTLESVPNEVSQLEVTSKGTNYISLRWLPSYPPTGELGEYKISYCAAKSWKRCNDFKSIIHQVPTRCKLWPDYDCFKMNVNKYKKEYIYTVQVQSKNKGNPGYSVPVEKEKIYADNKGKSNAPYGLRTSWTEENYLNISWYHPNATRGIISSFKIYVNECRHEYNISSEEAYFLIYNITIQTNLTFPDIYNVMIAACNLAGESKERAAVIVKSPPPIPEDSIKNSKESKEGISIIFQNTKQYKNRFKRFLYLLITECSKCHKEFKSYEDILCKHHKINSFTKRIEKSERSQWQVISSYNIGRNEHPKKLDIGKNATKDVIYNIKHNLKYRIGFIWIHEFGGYVRKNSTIIFIDTGTKKTEESSSLMIIIFSVIGFLVALLIMVDVCIRLKKRIYGYFGGNQTPYNFGSEYENNELISLDSLTANNSNSLIQLSNPVTICPGNPLFKTKFSRRIRVEDFQQYVKKAYELDEFDRQHKLFSQATNKLWTYGALPQNEAKNRDKDVIPYNHSRVILNKIKGVEYSDYINANYIDGYQAPRAYIATQGPKSNTLFDFWRMIWQENVTYIVVMANIFEKDEKTMEKYWPNDDKEFVVEDFTIISLGSETHNSYEYRRFHLHYKFSEPRQIGQLHFKASSDHKVPLYPYTLVPILLKMLTFGSNDYPIVVHCSAGVGRTGIVILCDICLRMAAAEGYVDVLAMLEHLRNQRANMVDNSEQYKLAHLVTLNCLMGLQTSIPINQNFAKMVAELFVNSRIAFQMNYIQDCEWEDDAMKTACLMDHEMSMVPEKNRFSDIIPDNTARVFLRPHPPSHPIYLSTYINAVQVDSFCEPGRFIVTQFPLPNTVGDFWRLVVDKDISVIACLNDIPISRDKQCGIFFPVDHDEFIVQDIINIKNVSNIHFQVYTILTFQMTVFYPGEQPTTRMVEILKFQGWPILNQTPNDCMDFITIVEDIISRAKKETTILVTCYDGATASGLLTAMVFLMEQIKLEHQCDICKAVRNIRTSRKQFINSEKQLKFLYKACLLYVGEKFNQYSSVNF